MASVKDIETRFRTLPNNVNAVEGAPPLINKSEVIGRGIYTTADNQHTNENLTKGIKSDRESICNNREHLNLNLN